MDNLLNHRNDIGRKDRPIFIAIIFLPLLLVFGNFDNDVWFILNSGRYVVLHGIPYIEPFTIHHGMAFVMQQWLSAVIFWLLYSTFGDIGLKLLVVVCYTLIIFVLYKLCMKVSDGYFFVSSIVVFCVSLLLGVWLTSRPSIFSTLILLIELYLLESFTIEKKKRYLFFLPVLSALLVNMHAAMWPMLFIIMGPYLIDAFGFKLGKICGEGYPKIGLFIAAAAMLAAGFVNPYGWDAMTYLFRSYGHIEISYLVSEMKPPSVNDVVGGVAILAMFLVVLGYILHKKGTTKLRYVLLTVGTAYMALSSLRSFLLFAICGSFPLAWYLKNMSAPVTENEDTPRTKILKNVLMGLIIAVVIFGVFYVPAQETDSVKSLKMLQETIAVIKAEDSNQPVVLYTGYNDGGYAEFEGIAPYIDPRAEVFVIENNHTDDIMKEYYDLQAGRLYYKDFLDKYQFTHLIVTDSDSLLVNLENDPDYTLANANEEYYLFEKIN